MKIYCIDIRSGSVSIASTACDIFDEIIIWLNEMALLFNRIKDPMRII